jgi:hypothetical protein
MCRGRGCGRRDEEVVVEAPGAAPPVGVLVWELAGAALVLVLGLAAARGAPVDAALAP